MQMNDGSMICIEETSVQLEGQDPFSRVSGGFLRVTGRVRSFYVKERKLATLEGEIIGHAFMDTDESPQQADGLLLSTDLGENTVYVLLLAAISSLSSGGVEFERKGLGCVWRSGEEPSVLEYFENCKEQTLTLI
jgi:hypothetical protein